uniref:Synaptonemal complex central element protein 1 n=1 Tax=Castor canadensis TaxID=51338 RepID=A0A8C0X6E9_CASCN
MAARPRPTSVEPAEATEQAKGQDASTQKIEDLMEMVKKLQKGLVSPPCRRIGLAWADRNSIPCLRLKNLGNNPFGFYLHFNFLTLRILRLHCQEKESEAQRKHTLLQECKERISVLNSQIEEEKSKQRQLRLDFEEQLETLMDQHKDLWEFHRPEQLAREICALDSSKEKLLKEEKLVEVKLEDVKHQLCSLFGPEGPSNLTEGLFLRSQEAAAAVEMFKEENRKAEELLEAAAQHHQELQQRCQQLQQKRQRLKEELEKHGVQISAQAQNMQEEGTSSRKVVNPGTGWQRAETVREGGWVREHGRYWESRGMICG